MQPNFLVILIDDLRFDEFGAAGHPYMKTPHIDRLAAEGAMFERAFHTTPICSPYRASIMTGQYASRHGIIDNVARDAASHRLPNYHVELKRLGYETAHIGKWHMGNDAQPRPGYDLWISFDGHGRLSDPVLNENGKYVQAIEEIRRQIPDFIFMAEVYWDLEWALQQQGFDYTYDKRLYDRLRERHPRPARDHLRAGLDFQAKLARFLENHDEPRAAAPFPPEIHRAAAIVSFLAPGLRFFHRGQFEGRKTRIPVQLRRGPREPVDPALIEFYGRFLALLCEPIVRNGEWKLLDCLPAWDTNPSWDNFIAFAWRVPEGNCWIVPVNYTDQRSQCYVPLPFEHLGGSEWRLRDLMGPASYDRNGYQLLSSGVQIDTRLSYRLLYTLDDFGRLSILEAQPGEV